MYYPNDVGAIPQGGRYEDKRARFDRCFEKNEGRLVSELGSNLQVIDLTPENAGPANYIDVLIEALMLGAIGRKSSTRKHVLMAERFLEKYRIGNVRSGEGFYWSAVENGDVRLTLQDKMSPVFIEGILPDRKVAFVRAETPYGNSDIAIDAYLIYSAEGNEDKLACLKHLMDVFEFMAETEKAISHTIREIKLYGGNSIELPEQSWTTWDEVFLAPEVVKDVREDIMFFVENKVEFEKVGLPYKRGYLLCGPPGNGKTSICRAIATSMPFAAFMFDFSNDNLGNSDLTQAFEWAADNAPAVFFLEDIDRIYSADDKNEKSNVTLDHLLNCLDGIATNHGVVVVATANNPEKLDPAILSRPGRFDKVVELKDPDYALRLRYLKHLFRLSDIEPEVVEWTAEETDGLSMAFMKEVFLVSMARALTSKEKLEKRHVEAALDAIFKQFKGVARKGRRKAGFGS